jgi:hypothetical protein
MVGHTLRFDNAAFAGTPSLSGSATVLLNDMDGHSHGRKHG